MSEPQLSVAATSTPISLEQAREACHLTTHNRDGELEDWIALAVDNLQRITRRQFVTATYTLQFDDFADEMHLPPSPLASITTVKYYDGNSVQQTIADTVYEAVTDQLPGFVRLKYNQTWPSVRGHPDDIIITYVCGEAVADVPVWIKQACKFLVQHYYEFGPTAEIPDGILHMLDRVGVPV